MAAEARDGDERESEIKRSLSGRGDFERLTGPGGLAGFEGTERLENHYLDTRELAISGRRAMLRLRIAPKRCLLTLKVGAELEAGFFQSVEVEAPLDREEALAILEKPERVYRLTIRPVEELRRRFGELPLAEAGCLVSERSRYRAAGYLVEVDRMVFPDGGEEFEVEVETEDPRPAALWLEGEFRRLGVAATPSRITKFARLLARLGKIRLENHRGPGNWAQGGK